MILRNFIKIVHYELNLFQGKVHGDSPDHGFPDGVTGGSPEGQPQGEQVSVSTVTLETRVVRLDML